ncbi:mCG147695 [Mus musculus]|nr:mCG147695 [Mus musculus]
MDLNVDLKTKEQLLIVIIISWTILLLLLIIFFIKLCIASYVFWRERWTTSHFH